MTSKRISLTLALAAAIGLAVPAVAQQHQHHRHGGQQGKGRMQGMEMPTTPWKELKAFHSIMHGSRHPIMEQGDFGPARGLADELAATADSLAASTPPTECQGEGLAEQARKVADAAHELLALVQKEGADDEVKADVEKVHAAFQPLMRACRPRGGGPSR